MRGRPAGMSCPVGQNHVTLALASLPVGLAAMVADRGLGVGLRQPLGLPATSEPLKRLSVPEPRQPWWRRLPGLCGGRGRSCPAAPDEADAREGERHHRPYWGSGAAPFYCEKALRRSIRDGPPRKRKKYGAYPFARLSLASARYLIEDAVEGCPAKSPEGDTPFPRPQTGGSDAPHVWAAQFSRPNRRLASGRVGHLSAAPSPQTDFGF